MALPVSRVYDFTAGDPILSSEVDAEFNQLVTELNLLPEKDGVLQTNLNSDLVDSFHVSAAGGDQKIPICDADVLQVDLNADLLDGLHASEISGAAFPVGTKLIFYQASPPGGWTLVTAPTNHLLTWKSGATGGTNAANSWTISGLSVTIDNHTLSTSQLPTHSHTVFIPTGFDAWFLRKDPVGGVGYDLTSVGSLATHADKTGSIQTGTAGSGSGHNHTGSISSTGAWRPPASYIIIASKD